MHCAEFSRDQPKFPQRPNYFSERFFPSICVLRSSCRSHRGGCELFCLLKYNALSPLKAVRCPLAFNGHFRRTYFVHLMCSRISQGSSHVLLKRWPAFSGLYAVISDKTKL
jgi:hypothetical protein